MPFNGSDPVSGATFAATNAAYTGAGACATPYFSLSFLHCDWQDGNGQTFPPWAGLPGAFDFADQLVVRFDVDATPIPAALPLFASALGLGGLIGWRRKRRANVSIAPA